jgi:AcrR family transcriptional regulator
MESQTLKRNETSRRIKHAATEVFAEAGFAGARVDEIARRAGVNKAMIYYHIGDKKALYAEVMHDVFRDTADRMARNIQESKTAEDKLKRFIHNLAATMDQHPYLPLIMQREIASGGQHIPDLVIQDLANIIGMIKTILDEGAEEGIFIQTLPIIVHLMVVGAFSFYKTGWPLRTRLMSIPDDLKQIDTKVSGKIAREIEKLILKAVKK